MDTIYDSPLHPLHLYLLCEGILLFICAGDWQVACHSCRSQIAILCQIQRNPSLLGKYLETHLFYVDTLGHRWRQEETPSGSEAGWLTGVVPTLSPLGSLISHQLRSLKVWPPAFKLMPSCFLCVWTSPGFTQDLLKGYIFLALIWHFGLIWDQTLSWKLVEMVFGTSPSEQGLFLWNSYFFSHQTFFSPLNSPFSFLLNLPEPIPLKWSFLRIQELKSKFLMLHGLKLNCEPYSNIFFPNNPTFSQIWWGI